MEPWWNRWSEPVVQEPVVLEPNSMGASCEITFEDPSNRARLLPSWKATLFRACIDLLAEGIQGILRRVADVAGGAGAVVPMVPVLPVVPVMPVPLPVVLMVPMVLLGNSIALATLGKLWASNPKALLSWLTTWPAMNCWIGIC